MHHAVAIEPVVLTFGFENGVRALPHVGTEQVVGHRAGCDLEIDRRDLGDHRCVRPVQIRVFDAIDPSRTIDRILGADVGVLTHGCSPQEARSTTKLTVVVALPPTLSVAKRSAFST